MSKPKAYYNEIDPFCVEWLRNLIKAGLIADGVVDNRSIVDVAPIDLKEFNQCHFFAGIGVWSYALRRSGWSDERSVWTGSCPCQPFSAAGSGKGFDDERHLWPYFFHLVEQCRPDALFGEQVASSDGLEWIDLVQSDMEGAGYAFAASDFCSAGVGAPHIRQRLYFFGQSLNGLANAYNHQHRGTQRRGDVLTHGKATLDGSNVSLAWQLGGTSEPVLLGVGHSDNTGLEGLRGGHQTARGGSGQVRPTAEASELSGLAEASELSGLADADDVFAELIGEVPRREGSDEREIAIRRGDTVGLADTYGGESELPPRGGAKSREAQGTGASRHFDGCVEHGSPIEYARATNGFWRSADWLLCRDGKFRPVEPCTFPLADGSPSRVGRLRAYGNAINAEAAKTFIEAAMHGSFGLDLI